MSSYVYLGVGSDLTNDRILKLMIHITACSYILAQMGGVICSSSMFIVLLHHEWVFDDTF